MRRKTQTKYIMQTFLFKGPWNSQDIIKEINLDTAINQFLKRYERQNIKILKKSLYKNYLHISYAGLVGDTWDGYIIETIR